MSHFDKIDHSIISLLHENTRMPATTIAKRLGIDVRTANKRINAMLESGAVRASVVITPESFGYSCLMGAYLEVDGTKFLECTEALKKDPRVLYIAVHWGDYRLEVQAAFKNNQEMHNYMNNELPQMEGVRILSSGIAPDIQKDIDSWFPGESAFQSIE